MKKLFTLLSLLMLSVGWASAGETHKISFNGANAFYVNGTEVDGPDIFSWNSAKHNFNNKFNGVSYDGIDYSLGLKMESATKVSFQSTAKSNVTIVQSTWSSHTLKFDDEELAVDDATTETGYRIYTIEDVAAGTHSMTRGSGESGVFCVIVEYTETAKQKLNSPEITYDDITGEVTINTVINATSYYYTTDGTIPSSTSNVYEGPFVVSHGTVIKAVASDNNVSFADSDPTELQVLLDLDEVEDPAINVLNGTFFIQSDVAGTTLEYRIGNGSWETFTRAITLTEDATVSARALYPYNGKVSGVTSEYVSVIPQPSGTTTVWLTYEEGTGDSNTWTNSEGYELTITGNADKKWSAGNAITVNGQELSSFKLSNGAQNTLVIPDGVVVKRATFYSYVNINENPRTTGWKEMNGIQYEVNKVPMGSLSDGSDPDIRVFDMDNATGSFTFTNTGEQICFVIALDVTGAETRPASSPKLYDLTKELSQNDIDNFTADEKWTVSEDGKTYELTSLIYDRNVYGPLMANGSKIEMTDGLLFTRDNSEGLAKGIKFNNKKNLSLINGAIIISLPETAKDDVIRIRMESSDDTGAETTFTVTNGDVASLVTVDKQDFEFKVVRDAATKLKTSGKVNIFQIAINKELPAETDGAATAIQEVQTAQEGGAVYNLAGQRVANGFKGVVVKDGKKMLVK
ncbi:MAG: chitobiase/beta-hexosaminidase C-terminal domain-containing protein [Prevotella sp.]|nr:chitobiase/beta-hexosaminidase C-terminal domain-containing protein [Prevotella sp.]